MQQLFFVVEKQEKSAFEEKLMNKNIHQYEQVKEATTRSKHYQIITLLM